MMLGKRLIVTFLLLMSLVSGAWGNGCVPVHEVTGYVSRTVDRPQWSDLGMEHVLAVNAPTVATPTVTRLPHNPSSGVGGSTAGAQSVRWEACKPFFHGRAVVHARGYIYVIQCLRL